MLTKALIFAVGHGRVTHSTGVDQSSLFSLAADVGDVFCHSSRPEGVCVFVCVCVCVFVYVCVCMYT